jgi:hypothetical protein
MGQGKNSASRSTWGIIEDPRSWGHSNNATYRELVTWWPIGLTKIGEKDKIYK